MFQTFISRHNSNFVSDKLVLTSVTPASAAPVLQTPKATSSTLYFDSLTVNAGNFFQPEDGIRDADVTGVQTCALPICEYTPRDVVSDDLGGMSFEDAIDGTIVNFDDGDIVTGTVVKVDKDEVLLDIGFKSEGVIPRSEERRVGRECDARGRGYVCYRTR